jgi:heme-degrading monooxygenase HmoA
MNDSVTLTTSERMEHLSIYRLRRFQPPFSMKTLRAPPNISATHLDTAMEAPLARTPKPPYYAVIFTSQRTDGNRGYDEMAERMVQLATTQPGFLGVESVRGGDGVGITVSYWSSEEAIAGWRNNWEHQRAQESGHRIWYENYQVRVARVERAYGKADRGGH